MKGTLIIFVKTPVAGRVKTRLAREVGAARAASIFRHLTELTIARVADSRWRTILAVDPPVAARRASLWPAAILRIPQARGDLGARMAAAIKAAPPGPVIIIGADAPGVTKDRIRAAFRALAGADAVFGPAADGGYWLVGIARRRGAPALFESVRWSSPFALGDSIASLPKRFCVRLLDELRDIDDAADLAALGPDAFRFTPRPVATARIV
jgi:hypothetical protein